MTSADGFVIAVEQHRPARIAGLMARQVRLQQEGFKEPVGVRQVPFRGAGILHALQSQILWLQRINQRLAAPSHRQQGVQQQRLCVTRQTLVGSATG